MSKSKEPADIATEPPIWLTVFDVAERMGCCCRSIRILIDEGDLPARKFPKRTYRILESDLAAYMTQPATTEKESPHDNR